MSLANANLKHRILRLIRRRAVLVIKIVSLLLVAVVSHTCVEYPAFAQQPASASNTPQIKNKINATETPVARDPRGITREQADAMLAELRQMRQLLERQQVQLQRALLRVGLAPEKLQMTVASGWHAMGRDNAPVTIVEFTDLQCPFCRRFHAEMFPMIKRDYIDTGKVRFVSRDMPIESHQYAFKAAEAVRCAGDQGMFWELRKAILESIVPPTEEAVLGSAKILPLDVTIFRACFDSGKYKGAIQTDANDAATLQINSTPTFVIARTAKDTLDGVRMVGALSYSAFQLEIDELLRAEIAKAD